MKLNQFTDIGIRALIYLAQSSTEPLFTIEKMAKDLQVSRNHLVKVIHFMAKQELFVPVLGSIYRTLGAFPVRRGAADRNAIKYGIDLLLADKVLAIFPEGTRSKNGQLGKAEPGALMMAGKARAVIVPTAVSGTNLRSSGRIWPKVKVKFGKPIYFLEDESVTKEVIIRMTDELMNEIQALLDKN